jgi:hypothetical protein
VARGQEHHAIDPDLTAIDTFWKWKQARRDGDLAQQG